MGDARTRGQNTAVLRGGAERVRTRVLYLTDMIMRYLRHVMLRYLRTVAACYRYLRHVLGRLFERHVATDLELRLSPRDVDVHRYLPLSDGLVKTYTFVSVNVHVTAGLQ